MTDEMKEGKKPKKEPMPYRVSFRVSHDEFVKRADQLRASGVQKSKWLRSFWNTAPSPEPVMSAAEIQKLIAKQSPIPKALSDTLSNLNQLTKLAHQTGQMEAAQIEEAIREIREFVGQKINKPEEPTP